ncbi:MAG: sialidase family protein [Bryobacteraceae bacterium]
MYMPALVRIAAAVALSAVVGLSAPIDLKLVSVKKIWAEAPHNAFGDLIRFRSQWFCVFREGRWHVARAGQEDDGKLRVIVSKDGEQWKPAALIAETGIDLRDPHFSITADGRLMIVAGGSEYPQGKYKTRQPRVMFSKDGLKWSDPQKVLEPGHWLWRVTWYRGRAYGVSKYSSPSKEMPENPLRVNLVTSADGVKWETVVELGVPGGDETSLRFLRDGRMVALMRRESSDGDRAMIGWSTPPYKQWEWAKTDYFVGGPNFVVLPGGEMIAGGRLFPKGDRKAAQTALGRMTLASYEPQLILPSGGDSSYPGFVWHGGTLWTMYYSSHEGSTAIYLAKVRIRR